MHTIKPVIFFTLLLALFLAGPAFAAVKKVPAKMQADTSTIKAKKFDAKAIGQFKKDKDFNYNGAAIDNRESIWARIWHWIWDKLFGWIGDATIGGKIFKYVLLGISVAFLLYVIFKSLGIDPIKLLRGEAKRIDVPYSESLENIHDIDFDAEIEKAISQHNYRLAVRLLYLRCLKQLSDNGLIGWQIDKTNSAYLYELAEPSQQQAFGILTRQFEYVWYGNFSIDKQAFGNISELFQNFKKQLP